MKRITLIYQLLGLIVLLFHASNLFSMVYHGTPYTMTQPNGKDVTVLLYGTDLYIDAESIDHYTLTKDETSGSICYALLSADGKEYASSGIVYQGEEAPDAVKMLVEPAIRISKEAREEQISQTRKILNKAENEAEGPTLRAATTLPDTVYGICILIDFPDQRSAVSRDQIEQFLNGDNQPLFGNAMSIKEYFQWISSGKLTYINYVPSKFYTTPNDFAYYAPMNATTYTIDKLIPEIRNAIMEWSKESPKNFSKLTQNSYGGIKAMNILYAGKCENKWATGLWPHQSYMQMKLDDRIFYRDAYHSYQITDIDTRLTMGTFVHENGHLVCNWPDFYQYDEHEPNNADKYNVGDAFAIASETNPAYPNAWALDQLGWLTHKQDITDVKGGKVITLPKGVGHAAVYQGTGANAREKYYIEVRDKHYGTWNNRDKGIFIWHVNEDGDNNYPSQYELLDCRPANDANPFWAKGNGPDHFSDDSNPNGRWDNGANSGIYLWDFSPYSEQMTFRCGKYIEIPEFTKTEIKTGAIHTEYADTITFIGGEEPYRTTLYAGELPEGIHLSENGILYGIADQISEETFTIQVTDAKGKIAYQTFTLSIITSTPYDDKPYAIPGSFQMEMFDKGGEGIAYQTNKIGNYIRNDGALFPTYKFTNRNTNTTLGYAVIYSENKEWLQYTVNVKEEGYYDMTLRNATNYDAVLDVVIDFQEADTMAIAGVANATITSNSRGYKYTTKQILLPEGIHQLRLTAKDVTHTLYMDSISFAFVARAENTKIAHTEDGLNECQLVQNPSSNLLTLINTNGSERITVFTVTSELVEQIDGEIGETSFGENYSPGLYIIRVDTDSSRKIFKAIIKRR